MPDREKDDDFCQRLRDNIMRVNFARNIDYWLGIPVCFVLSVFYRIQKIFIPGRFEEIEPRKIMFLELSEMGSAILAYSAVKKAKEAYPDAKLYFWIFKENEDSVHILNVIPEENVITMRSKNILVLIIDTARNLWRLWKEKIDVVIDMELFSRFSGILSYLSGARIRVGFYRFSMEGLYRGNLHTHKVTYNPYIHISKNFLALVNSLKANPEDMPFLKMNIADYQTTVPKIESSREAEENIWRKLKEINGQINKKNKIIILNPGINDILPLRRWPIEHYIELAKELLKDEKVFIVLIGLKPQSSDAQFASEAIRNKRCINFAGKTTVNELIDLCNISTLLISHDSGATNLASLTQVNMIVLFGPETPVLYAPMTDNKEIIYKNFACSPCVSAYNHRRSVCRDNKCLKMITVKEVYNAAKIYINTKNNARENSEN